MSEKHPMYVNVNFKKLCMLFITCGYHIIKSNNKKILLGLYVVTNLQSGWDYENEKKNKNTGIKRETEEKEIKEKLMEDRLKREYNEV